MIITDEERRVIGKAEFGEKGENTRYVITNISGDPKILYKDLYCARGESENRVKEVQNATILMPHIM